jgi:hypothetical protein
LVLNCFEGGEEQTDQNRNDRDDDQQFNEGKGAVCSGERTRLACWRSRPRDRELFRKRRSWGVLHGGGIMPSKVRLHNVFVQAVEAPPFREKSPAKP